jgi:5-formyltetrahydrofolate cyclo-ligase
MRALFEWVSFFMQQRRELRLALRHLRQQLDPVQRTVAALKLAEYFCQTTYFTDSQHIAFYMASDGEIDPGIVMQRAWDAGKLCYLPVLSESQEFHLDFVLFQKGDPLQKNRFGIWEPLNNEQRLLDLHHLDLVLVPLVAFDESGNRLGMGGGYFDRTFGNMRHYNNKPVLLGLAFEIQKVKKIPCETWDIPMQGIITEEKYYPGKKV